MTVLVYLEHADGEVDEPSLQALTLARSYAGGAACRPSDACGDQYKRRPRRSRARRRDAPRRGRRGVRVVRAAAVAEAIVELAGTARRDGRRRPGTERGNEVMAHVGALLDLPVAANCVAAPRRRPAPRSPASAGAAACSRSRASTRRRRSSRCSRTRCAIETTPDGEPALEAFTPSVSDAAGRARVVERVGASTGGISLADAKVVVSGGRGAGSTEGFGVVEELAGLLGGAVGCSRAVTMAGWRPHTDQVGQTGTKIAPDLYIACGISGATQHMAGCKGAKRILAINADREAPILASADYAVIGDMHEILPALSAAIRAARSSGARVREHGRLRESALARRPPRSRSPAGLFPRRAHLLYRIVRLGQPVDRSGEIGRRVRNEATVVLGQRKLLQRLGPGLVHAFIFWGFVVLFPTIVMALLGAVDPDWTLPWLGHQGWFFLLVDVFCVLVLVGRRVRVPHPQGAAAGAVRGEPPRRGRPHPRPHRPDRDDAPPAGTPRRSRSGSTSGRRAGRRSRTRSPRS